MSTPSPIQAVALPLFKHHNIKVYIKRDDLIHPIISGNKWRKLKQNLIEAKQLVKQGVLSFGGAYSNHIHALAFACRQHNLASVGIIRGEPHYANNATLAQVQRWGMKLIFVDRATYRLRFDAEYLQQLQHQYPDYAIVPEGGSNPLALTGMADVINELDLQLDYDCLFTATGSGGTLAGLINADSNRHQLYGVAVLKQAQYLNKAIKELLPEPAKHYKNWRLLTEHHCGGYGKFSHHDCVRIQTIVNQTGIPFEPIYSGKMLLAFMNMVEQGYFSAGQRIVLLHTGGLQGLLGLAERNKVNLTQWHLPSELQVQ